MKYAVWTIGIDHDTGGWNYESSCYRYAEADSWQDAAEVVSWRLDEDAYVVAVAVIPEDGAWHRARWHDCTPYGMKPPHRYGKKYV